MGPGKEALVSGGGGGAGAGGGESLLILPAGFLFSSQPHPKA